MLEYAIVGLIVAAAVLYAARKFMPAAWRKRVAYRLGGADSTLGRLVNDDASCGSGCDTCKACDEPAADDPRVIKIRKE